MIAPSGQPVNESHIWKRSPLTSSAFPTSDALKSIGEVFDAAWAEITGNFGNDPVVGEAARLKLADAILLIASQDRRDPKVRKNAGERLALDYRDKKRLTSSSNGPRSTATAIGRRRPGLSDRFLFWPRSPPTARMPGLCATKLLC